MIENDYPHKCSRCGMCCLVTPCKVAMTIDPSMEKGMRCRLLMLGDNGITTCPLVVGPDTEEIFGIGKGCCISAKTVTSEGIMDYAASTAEHKREMVKHVLNKQALTILT
jgi:hypothetical protein